MSENEKEPVIQGVAVERDKNGNIVTAEDRERMIRRRKVGGVLGGALALALVVGGAPVLCKGSEALQDMLDRDFDIDEDIFSRKDPNYEYGWRPVETLYVKQTTEANQREVAKSETDNAVIMRENRETATAYAEKNNPTPEATLNVPWATPEPSNTSEPPAKRPSRIPDPTETDKPTREPRPSRTDMPSRTPKPSRTDRPSRTPYPTSTKTPSRTATLTETPRYTATVPWAPTPTKKGPGGIPGRPTWTPSPSAEASPTPIGTDTPVATETVKPTETQTPLPTATETVTPRPTETEVPRDIVQELDNFTDEFWGKWYEKTTSKWVLLPRDADPNNITIEDVEGSRAVNPDVNDFYDIDIERDHDEGIVGIDIYRMGGEIEWGGPSGGMTDMNEGFNGRETMIETIMRTSPGLKYLRIIDSDIGGPLEVYDNYEVAELSFPGNQLSGEVDPRMLVGCPNVVKFDISNNEGLSGEIIVAEGVEVVGLDRETMMIDGTGVYVNFVSSEKFDQMAFIELRNKYFAMLGTDEMDEALKKRYLSESKEMWAKFMAGRKDRAVV